MSGLFTPIDSMAPWVQTVSLINPVRHFVAIARAVLIKGAGLAEIARPLLDPRRLRGGDADRRGPAVLQASRVREAGPDAAETSDAAPFVGRSVHRNA